MTTFEPIPSKEIPIPITGRYFGVRLPRSVPFFDCRWPDVSSLPVRDGRTLWSSERAAHSIGLIARNVTYPCSVQFYFDSRSEHETAETARVIRSSREQLAKQWKRYREAIRHPAQPGAGGSIAYKPTFVALCNYGISVGADDRNYVVGGFH